MMIEKVSNQPKAEWRYIHVFRMEGAIIWFVLPLDVERELFISPCTTSA